VASRASLSENLLRRDAIIATSTSLGICLGEHHTATAIPSPVHYDQIAVTGSDRGEGESRAQQRGPEQTRERQQRSGQAAAQTHTR